MDLWLKRIALAAVILIACYLTADRIVDWYTWRVQVTTILNAAGRPAPAPAPAPVPAGPIK